MSIDVTALVGESSGIDFKPLDPGIYKVSCLGVKEVSNEYGESFEIDLQVHQPRRKMKQWLNRPKEPKDWTILDLCFKSFGKNIFEDACDESEFVDQKGQTKKKVTFHEDKITVLEGNEASVELAITPKGKNRVIKWLPVGTNPNNEPQVAETVTDDDDIPF